MSPIPAVLKYLRMPPGAQVAYDAKALAVYSRLNGACDLIVQDASSLAAQGERLSFADLQLRAQAVDQARAPLACTVRTPYKTLARLARWALRVQAKAT